MKNKWTLGLFFLIIAVSVSLRFWRLGAVPISPDWDEVALGYNAYSVLQTGKDEYGTRLPLTLRSYDDYKPPLYMYLTIPSIAVFGLSTWATRLPSALMGVLAVIGVFFLVGELFHSPKLSLISSLLLAISPWHIQFSRIAFEANLGVTLNIWALYFFFRGFRENKYLLASAFVFGLSLYAYHSERLFVPLLVAILLILFWKELQKAKKYLCFSIIVGLIVILPLVTLFFDKNTLTRLRGTSSLADKTGLLMRSVEKMQYDLERGDTIGAFFENRRLVFMKTLADGYLSFYSLRWLFISGDNNRHHAPDFGLLYLWELPVLCIGILTLPKKGRMGKFLILWGVISPIAASPTTELPHAIRTLVVLPLPQILVALGIVRIALYAKKLVRGAYAFLAKLCVLVALFVVSANIFLYLHMYFFHLNSEYSEYWQYGYKEAVEIVKNCQSSYDKIVVSTSLEQPHMFFLFFLAYDPKTYLAEGGTASGGFAEVRNRFGKYEFRRITWEKEEHTGRVLYVGPPNEVTTPNVASIRYLNGKEAIRIGT